MSGSVSASELVYGTVYVRRPEDRVLLLSVGVQPGGYDGGENCYRDCVAEFRALQFLKLAVPFRCEFAEAN